MFTSNYTFWDILNFLSLSYVCYLVEGQSQQNNRFQE